MNESTWTVRYRANHDPMFEADDGSGWMPLTRLTDYEVNLASWLRDQGYNDLDIEQIVKEVFEK
jgi:hypothetical protein